MKIPRYKMFIYLKKDLESSILAKIVYEIDQLSILTRYFIFRTNCKGLKVQVELKIMR